MYQLSGFFWMVEESSGLTIPDLDGTCGETSAGHPSEVFGSHAFLFSGILSLSATYMA